MKENTEIWLKEVITGIVTILGGLPFSIFCGLGVFNGADNITRIVFIPFFICGLTILIRGFVYFIKGLNLKKALNDTDVLAEDVFENDDKLNIVDKIFSKLYLVGFLLFWFGFLIVFDYIAIRDGQTSMFIFSLLFWAVGIFVAIKNFGR